MTAQEKAPAKTGAVKHIGKYATKIVALRDGFTLGLCRFIPTIERITTDDGKLLLILLVAAYAGLSVWGWLA